MAVWQQISKKIIASIAAANARLGIYISLAAYWGC